ncbi:3360_t:CDS:10 [Ambispora leptoticha]|uniref:3360_t:CDS:1 n=1 Tax=Ambispora leptoticha TaxID=144679 RepID=A0A9N8YNV6_9GLOM|nr:3360_t:CDS:10 [Ambispora leptoticha]
MSNSPRRSPRKNRRASTSFLFSKSTSKLESEEELHEVLKKREQRRYTIAPAKSILKASTNSENTLTLDLNQESIATSKSTIKPSTNVENTVTLDFTQGGTPRRKSLGRRVSFAATAQVRLFEKVTPESNPNAEVHSYISGDSDGSSSEIMNSTLLDNVGLLPRITDDNLFANLQVHDNDQGKNELDDDSHEDSDMSLEEFNVDNEGSDMDIDESGVELDEFEDQGGFDCNIIRTLGENNLNENNLTENNIENLEKNENLDLSVYPGSHTMALVDDLTGTIKDNSTKKIEQELNQEHVAITTSGGHIITLVDNLTGAIKKDSTEENKQNHRESLDAVSVYSSGNTMALVDDLTGAIKEDSIGEETDQELGTISVYSGGHTMALVDDLTGVIKENLTEDELDQELRTASVYSDGHTMALVDDLTDATKDSIGEEIDQELGTTSVYSDGHTMALVDDLAGAIKEESTEEIEEESDQESTSNDSLLPLNSIKEFYEKFEVFFMDQSSIPMRRQTIIPDFGEEPKLADYVNAVAVIRPQMEIYESNSVFFMEQDKILRRKISKAESNEDYQPLLRQYLDITPDVKELIKPRFRIIKKYCRLAAKKEWHDLREAQLEDLKKRLEDNLLTLKKDKEKTETFSKIIRELLPKLRIYHQELANKLATAQARRNEIEKCDQEQLMNMVDAVEEQNTQISKFQNDLKRVIADRDAIQQKINNLKIEMKRSLESIEKAKYTIDENKVYTKEDIKKARDDYYRLQEQYSWRPITISPQIIEMIYDNHLYVRLDMESIIRNEEEKEIMGEQKKNELRNHEDLVALELRLESQGIKKSRELEYYEIIVRCLQSTIPKYSSQIKVEKIHEILQGISVFWKKAKLLYLEVESLKRKFTTEILAIRDENTEKTSLCLRSSFLIKPTKFFLNFVFKYQDILSFPELRQLQWEFELGYGSFNDEIQVEISNAIRHKFESGGPKALREACDDVLKLFA